MAAGLPPTSTPYPAPPPAPAAERVALARDLADLLVELSLALGHFSAYPQGHPLLLSAAERFTRIVAAVLASRDPLTLGVARRQFIIDGVATDPRNALLGNLAQRLHRHRIAGVRFRSGITLPEVETLLRGISSDPRLEPGPIGLRQEAALVQPHIELFAARYARLELLDELEPEAGSGAEAAGMQLWHELAGAALPEGQDSTPSGSSHPGVIAAAIERHAREASYDQTVIGYLQRVASAVATGESVEHAWLKRRLSRLIAALDPATLERLLQVGGGMSGRRFVVDASQTIAADAVLKVVQAAAETSGRTISDNMMLLLEKLAHQAETAEPEVAASADTALRESIEKLVDDWELDDPNPHGYTAVLQGVARTAPPDTSAVEFTLDARLVVEIGLEVGESGSRVRLAAERLIDEGRTRQLTELLQQAPDSRDAGGAGEALWRHLVTLELLRKELAAEPPDLATVETVATRLGAAAAEPLLEALALSLDRSVRWSLLNVLTGLGPGIVPAIAGRLAEAPWFLQRNLLVLLGRLGQWPEEIATETYTRHPDVRVRREAYRLLLDLPRTRDAMILAGLADPDPTIAAAVLRAAGTSCPPDALPLVGRLMQDSAASSEVRVLAVRLLAAAGGQLAREKLLDLVWEPRRWWWGHRLAHKSPVVLAALGALAAGWDSSADVSVVLARARDHRDPEIRAAAHPRGTA